MASMIELLRRYDLKPKKSWGQNFLNDQNALLRIIYACNLNEQDKIIVEIGAGLGALTEQLIGQGRKVLAIERDRDLVPVLLERFADVEEIEIIEADAMKYDLEEAAKLSGGKIKVIGNLPYQLSAPIIFKLLENRKHISSAYILLQKEVAQRLVATHGSKDYSLLSVLLGRVATVHIETEISKNCFLPVPKVDSAFVSIQFNKTVSDDISDNFFTLFVKGCFHQRRKKLSNSLGTQPFIKLDKSAKDYLISNFTDLMKMRAEALSVEQLYEMAKELDRYLQLD